MNKEELLKRLDEIRSHFNYRGMTPEKFRRLFDERISTHTSASEELDMIDARLENPSEYLRGTVLETIHDSRESDIERKRTDLIRYEGIVETVGKNLDVNNQKMLSCESAISEIEELINTREEEVKSAGLKVTTDEQLQGLKVSLGIQNAEMKRLKDDRKTLETELASFNKLVQNLSADLEVLNGDNALQDHINAEIEKSRENDLARREHLRKSLLPFDSRIIITEYLNGQSLDRLIDDIGKDDVSIDEALAMISNYRLPLSLLSANDSDELNMHIDTYEEYRDFLESKKSEDYILFDTNDQISSVERLIHSKTNEADESKRQISNLQNRASRLDIEKEELELQITTLVNTNNSLKVLMKDTTDKDAKALFRSDIAKNEDIIKLNKNRIKDIEKELKSLSEELRAVTERNKTLKNTIASLNKRKSELKSTKPSVIWKSKAISEDYEKLEEIKDRLDIMYGLRKSMDYDFASAIGDLKSELEKSVTVSEEIKDTDPEVESTDVDLPLDESVAPDKKLFTISIVGYEEADSKLKNFVKNNRFLSKMLCWGRAVNHSLKGFFNRKKKEEEAKEDLDKILTHLYTKTFSFDEGMTEEEIINQIKKTYGIIVEKEETKDEIEEEPDTVHEETTDDKMAITDEELDTVHEEATDDKMTVTDEELDTVHEEATEDKMAVTDEELDTVHEETTDDKMTVTDEELDTVHEEAADKSNPIPMGLTEEEMKTVPIYDKKEYTESNDDELKKFLEEIVSIAGKNVELKGVNVSEMVDTAHEKDIDELGDTKDSIDMEFESLLGKVYTKGGK